MSGRMAGSETSARCRVSKAPQSQQRPQIIRQKVADAADESFPGATTFQTPASRLPPPKPKKAGVSRVVRFHEQPCQPRPY